MKFTQLKSLSVLSLLIVMGWLVYENGLSGGFIFDDDHSLSHLEVFDNDLSLEKLTVYLGKSDSGPLKRPISIFSFLIDAKEWPADAYSFKRTNLIIHLINGGLLYFVLLALFKIKGLSSNKRIYIAGISTGLWLLHPFLVSTTLYIVQRMAMMPLTFMLIGFILYLQGRCKYELTQGKKGKMRLFIAVYGMSLLAMLSKENGVIFLWLIALFEVYIIQHYLLLKPLSKNLSLWLLKLPGLALLGLIIIQIPGFIEGYDLRVFNMGERLLSQTRAISKYLYHLFLPGYFTEGVFIDGFKYSTSLFKPIATIFSTLFIIGLLSLAWVRRKHWVWFSFSVFFFFIAQSLESSIVPLELYFEHRVYIASVFISVPITLFFVKISNKSKIYLIIPLLLCLLLGSLTYMRSNIWGNNLQLHKLSIDKFPESLRAYTLTAVIYERMGLYNEATETLKEGMDLLEDLELKISLLTTYCTREMLEEKHVDDLIKDINVKVYNKHDHNPFINFIRVLFASKCLGENKLDYIYELAEAVENNPNSKFKQRYSAINFIKGHVELKRKNYKKAEQLYIKSFLESDRDYSSINAAILEFIKVSELDHAKNLLIVEEEVFKSDYSFDWHNVGDLIKGYRLILNNENNVQEIINHNPS